ncbi:hypothetical protein CALVIDRAFT_556495 [Calocera viscosa TUFC12733]|uniref:F-box domain-containing protein n=1 Tax=Calocera viscosa (strain TUFC12733) TaxID=1330018 RepID=A0A167K2N5_CALVF|nr:hypothetical protein CALVIDRAFT_556495 [Calocera viscosa TUFC12733]
MSTICGLPLEVILHILDFAQWKDLLRLTSTCKFFRSVVQETSALQYIIELGIYGLTDCRNGPELPYSNRLKHLQDFQSHWRTATFARTLEVSLPGTWDGWTYELQKGVFARSLLNQSDPVPGGSSEMVLVNLRTAKHWRCELDLEVQDFSIDPDQNLAVLFQWMGMEPDTAETRIHLRRLDNLEPHPLAEQVIVTYDLGWQDPPLGWTIHSIQIAGDLVGVLFDPRSPDEVDKIVVWNWRTGQAIAELPATRIVGLDSFFLLSERVMVVPDKRQGSIHVFLLMGAETRPVHWKCFVLPSLTADRRMDRIISRSDPAASAIPPSSFSRHSREKENALHPRPTYQVSGDARLLCFVINIFRLDAHIAGHSVHLYTPMDTFMPSPEGDWNPDHGVKYVPWKDWGPTMTRFVMEPALARNPFVTFIHGHRCVMASTELEAEDGHFNLSHYIHVYDFNQNAIRRDLLRNSKVDDIHREPSTLSKESFFGTMDVVTSLPYRSCRMRLDVPFEALMMDGENVIALTQQRGQTGPLDVLYIHQIGPIE